MNASIHLALDKQEILGAKNFNDSFVATNWGFVHDN